MVDDGVPMVGIVVVNYFRIDLTRRCLESLERLTWPADRVAVALVDNGSEPGDLDGIRERFPTVRVVETGENLGFGGACNRGFDVLLDCRFIALLNNDAVPEPGWLEPLVDVLGSDPRIGAAVPKVLLAQRFISVELRSPSVRPGDGDDRSLGVQLCGAKVGDRDVSDRIQLAMGFWGWEHDAVTIRGSFAWSDGHGVARLPVDDTSSVSPRAELRLACGNGQTSVQVGERCYSVEPHPGWVDIGEVGATVDLINSAGTVLLPDGAIADRGYLEPDGPEFAEAAEVFGWSGAAVLLSRDYLDDVGGFDERFFLYYEDADLSWRGRLCGWTYRFEPASVVRHDHSATAGERSALVAHLSRRNHLLFVAKCAPWPVIRTAAVGQARELVGALRQDVVRRLAAGRRPVLSHLGGQLRVLGGLAPLLPAAIRQRRSLLRRRRCSTSDRGT